MRGSLPERSAVLHLNNKQDRANQSLLRIRLTVVTSADRGPVMCASPLLSRKTPVSPKLQLFLRYSAVILALSLWLFPRHHPPLNPGSHHQDSGNGPI